MGLDDPYTAYCFDEAVYGFGTYVENAMTEAENKQTKDNQKAAARLRALQTILSSGGSSKAETKQAQAGQFRDPAALLTKK